MPFNVVLTAAVGEVSASNPLSLDISTLLLQSLNVAVILAVLYFLLFRPLGTLMAKREEHIATSLSDAAQTRQEADELLAEYQKRMQLVQAEIDAKMAEATRVAKQYLAQRKAEADTEYQALIAKAKAELEAERTSAMAAMRDEVAELAVMAASQVLGRTINAADHRQLIEDFVQKVSESHVTS